MALALAGFALRALIPVGFEPANGSLSLVLCQEGFPAQFFSHGRRSAPHGRTSGHGGQESHCAFCNGASPAPAFSCLPTIARVAPVAIGVVGVFTPSTHSVRLSHTPQARAPPRLV